MKRFIMIAALLLLMAMPMMAERVTPETACKVAATFLNNNGAKTAQLIDLSKEAGFPNLYIFNGNPGFVVMAADDCVQPILGYSLTGKFVAENMPTNVSGWLQGYNDEIQYAIDSKMKATAETSKQWKDLFEGNSKAAKATIVVDALVQTQWDQDPLYNSLCPYISGVQTVTGCAATAVAQIMKYWEYPNHGIGSHSYNWNGQTLSANFGATTYDWVNMPLSLSGSSSQTEINAVATLMYHCGVALNMQYGLASTGGSSAYPTDIPSVLVNYFNYKSSITIKSKSSYNDSEWINMLKTELNESRPVQYNGWGANNSGGHSFICDGYDNSNYFHFNWGWSGVNDGFYSLSNLVPGSGGSGGGSYNFSYNQKAIFGIQPVECAAGEPSNLIYTRDGFNVTLNWTAGEGAASYNIYRNNVLLGNTTSTTYTDNINYGTYSYFVKSKDANGSQSLPTNTITVSVEPIPTNLTVTLNGNNADLTWEEPEWSAPQTGDEMLTYGNGNFQSMFGVTNAKGYYGHRYPVSMLNANKVLYKVSFYAAATGSFAVYIYSANSGNSKPQTLLFTKSVTASSTGWCDIELEAEEFIHINNSKDLWVFIYDPEAKQYPMGAEASTNENGSYYSAQESNGPTSWVGQISGSTMLIRTYITDDSFQYNLYDNNTLVASELSGTSYTISSITNNKAHQYTLRTLFNDSETSASNMAGIALGNATLTSLSLNANDKMTVTENSQLTVSGTLSSTNADNLILENGAQLIHSSEGVQATVLKDIAPYTTDSDGWNFIASPVTESFAPSSSNGFLNGNSELNLFDLYYYDEPTYLWKNYESQTFDIEHKKGYLYANGETEGTTLEFVGTLLPSNTNVTITNLSHEATKLNGFNLVGNPFACNAAVDQDYYVINNTTNTVTLAPQDHVIAPCEAVFVQATEGNTTVTFSKAEVRSYNNNSFDITLSQGRAHIDRARVRLDEGRVLEKFSMHGEKNTQLYIPQNGQELAVACANGRTEMPVNFKAVENGTYTLTTGIEGLDLDYLHLIDNMTGEDIDLLATPSYTFEAKTSDHASRFKLVLDNNGSSTDSETFAYYADGEILITGIVDACDASLQVVDMTGRVVVEGETLNRVSTSKLTPSVYVIRLIDGEMVHTQKIVVE